MSRIPQKTAPFKGYESQIKVLFWSLKDVENMEISYAIAKAETLVASQKISLQTYELEHKLKLWTVIKGDFSFDMSISKKYPDLAPLFKNISECTENIKDKWNSDITEENRDFCLAVLQKLKTLPDRDENIQVLKSI
jgi:hypothetical protein